MHWRVNPNVNTARQNEELVLLHLATGQFFGLDPVGSRIWALLQNPSSLEEIVSVIVQEYRVAEDRARKDVSDLLASLEHHQLVMRE